MNIIFISIFIILTGFSTTFAQYTGTYFQKQLRGEFDTLAYQQSQSILKETKGLLETTINPDEYILGPGDVLTISINTPKPKIYELAISPDGKLLIPEVGIIKLDKITLSTAQNLIKETVLKVLKADDVSTLLSKVREFKVVVGGAVQMPSIVSASAVDRVSEVIEKAGGLKKASLRKIFIIRKGSPNIIKVDLLKFYALGDKSSNPYVEGGDHIIVPTYSIDEFIGINGEVPQEGIFEFIPGDSLSTLIRFAQGFLKSSFLDSVEFIRFDRKNNVLIKKYLNLNNWYELINTHQPLPGDFPLEAGDRVYIRKKLNWYEDDYVAVSGEVKYPGRYPIVERKYRVSDILEAAGGVTEMASLENSVLVRRVEWKTEDPELDRIKGMNITDMSENELKYYKARIAERRGYMAINFNKILQDKNCEDNVLLIGLDSIHIMKKNFFINVQGRVNNPGLILYKPNYTYLDYIQQAGGFGYRADERGTLVVKSKGEQFLAKNFNYVLEPGDNIIVPPETEVSFIDVFTQALTITTQLITIAGVIFTFIRLR